MATVSSGTAASYAVVFVHGFLDAPAIWNGVIAKLDAHRIIASSIDLPGMGTLAADCDEISLERYASVVSGELSKHDLPVILVGQSMGAQVAELAAVANPGKVAGLVLVTPVPLGGVKAPAEMVAPFKLLGGNPEAQRQTRAALSPALNPAQLDVLDSFGASVLPATAARLVDIWNEGCPSGDAPSEFTGPVVILRGGADEFVTEDMATMISGRFAGSRVEEVAGGGHWLHLEQPTEVARVINAMIADLEVGGDWQQAFKKQSADAFAATFAEDVQLEAGVMFMPVRGRDNIKQVMEAASKIYEHLEFVAHATIGNDQYLQWEARAFGGIEISGVTIITRNEWKAIQNVAIHHRPLGAALKFSVAIGERLAGKIDSSHFLAAGDLPSPFRS